MHFSRLAFVSAQRRIKMQVLKAIKTMLFVHFFLLVDLIYKRRAPGLLPGSPLCIMIS